MAVIKDLRGKYYGTEVEFEHRGETHTITIWTADHFGEPFASERELAEGWTAEEQGHDHVEDALSYRIACIVRDALTKEGF